MNKHILLVMKWLNDPDSVSEYELDVAMHTSCVGVEINVMYVIYKACRDAHVYSDKEATKSHINSYFELSGEDRTKYEGAILFESEKPDEIPPRTVVIESPFASYSDEQFKINQQYASDALSDALMKNEAPYASHLLYARRGVLNDNEPQERKKGIDAGFAFKQFCVTIFYVDLGFSEGMIQALEYCNENNLPFEIRRMPKWS